MKKLDSLKALLTRSVPSIAANPETLAIFVDRGRVGARAGSLSFEYRYALNLVVQDFAGSVDEVTVPLLAWIEENQPELLQKQDSEPFAFESELLAGDLLDLSITLELTERVRVQRAKGGVNVEHLSDTLPADVFEGAEGGRLWAAIGDDLAAGTAEILAQSRARP